MTASTSLRFDAIVVALGAQERRDGQWHADCPYCKKEAKPGQRHFAFNEHGFYCFVCGANGGLGKLARDVLNAEYEPVERKAPVVRPAKANPVAGWSIADYSASFPVEAGIADWRAYRPSIPVAFLTAYHLGKGYLPGSRGGKRLTLPIIDGNRIVCIRGRAIEKGDEPKWIATGGWHLDDLPLYNLEYARSADTIMVVESPVDCIVARVFGIAAVATYSASYWSERWARQLAATGKMIVVTFDNDAAGEGARVRVANSLLQYTKNVTMFNWRETSAGPKDDLSALLEKQWTSEIVN